MPSPSKILLLLEVSRSIFEYMYSIFFSPTLYLISPKGDNHPVIVFPGLGASDGSTEYMRSYLTTLGYSVYSWGLGRNIGPRNGLDSLLTDIECKIKEVSKEHNGSKVSLIGWSLGGIYAREIAKICPDLIRQVITLGTPFKGDATSSNVTFLYDMLSNDKSHYDPYIIDVVSKKPDVPFTSIYSKTDGVVHWTSSIEEDSDISENIEIPCSSHLGLGHNYVSMYIIADRLSQSEHDWKHWAVK